jgi:integrase
VVVCIAAVLVSRRFGRRPTKLLSSRGRRRICTCRYCPRCGPGNGKAIFSGLHGPPMTARISGCSRERAERALSSQWGAPLKASLNRAVKRSTIILTNSDGKPWTSDGFRTSWRKASQRVGITDLTFHDLRGTAVTRLAICGCTEAEIATITGHSLRSVRSILDAHYLNRDPALARMRLGSSKGEQKCPTDLPTGPSGFTRSTEKRFADQWWAHKDSNLGPAD